MAIEKIISGDSQEALIKQAGVLIQVWEDRFHIKCAASPLFSQAELRAMAPPPGYFLSHAITMGSAETYGANRNCFFADEPVRTPFGFVRIQDVKKGDLVLTEDGTFQAVIRTYQRDYAGIAVRLHAQGLALPVACTSEHPLYRLPVQHVRNEVLYKRQGPKKDRKRPGSAAADKTFGEQAEKHAGYAEAHTLRPGDWVAVPIVERHKGAASIFETDPWVYGLYLADACVYREYRDIESKGEIKGAVFTLGAGDDSDVIPHLVSCVNRAGNKTSVLESYTSEKGRRVSWGRKAFALTADRLFGDGATTKTIRSEVFELPTAWKLGMLAGWFDGDGALEKTGEPKYRGTLRVSTASLDLASAGQRLLASVGIPSSVSSGLNKQENGCFGSGDLPLYSLSVGPAHSNKILAYGKRLKPHKYAEDRKRVVTQRIHAGKLWFKVTKVELFEQEAPCYNLEVSGSHTYVTTVLGHNCDDWPHAELMRKHASFLTHGRNYHEHRNQKPEYACGIIKAAKYCPVTQRGEIVFWTEIEKAAKQFERARKNEEQHGSMAATVAHDVCECCDHISKVAHDRCDCIRNTPGEYLPRYKKFAHMINIDPTFKDYSWVERPADRIAHTMNYMTPILKAASESRVLRGDELAILYGQCQPPWVAELQKIAEFDVVRHEDPAKQAAASAVLPSAFHGQFDSELLQKMSEHSYPGKVMRSLVKRAMVMPLASFNAWVTGASLEQSLQDPVVKEAGQKLASIRAILIQQVGQDPQAADAFSQGVQQFEPMSCGCEDIVDQFMDKAREQFSLRYEALAKRACHNPTTFFAPNSSPVSSEAFSLGALYNAYLVKTASLLDDDWMISAQMAFLR